MAAPPAELALPKALPGFEHIARYWDPVHARAAAKILPGEFYVTGAHELIVTVLGSCVAACVRDPALGIGGMNHFMLPTSEASHHGAPRADWGLVTRFGNFAMESLINELVKRGSRRDRLEVKLFGGAAVLAGMTDIGRTNIDFVRHYLEVEHMAVAVEDLGGRHPRKVYFDPQNGRAHVRYLHVLANDTIMAREHSYRHALETVPTGSVEMF